MSRSKITNDNNGSLSLIGKILKICLNDDYEPVIPEDRLLMAVLDRAIKDLELKDQATRAQARSYFLSEEVNEDSMSFVWLCNAIGCSSERFRLELLRLGML